jgi:flagellar assembly factor FliW
MMSTQVTSARMSPAQLTSDDATPVAPSPEPAAGSTTVEPVPDELPEIRLVRAIPGFPDLVRYVLVRLGGEGSGVLFELRSVEAPQIRFLVGVPDAFFPEYSIELDDVTCADLELTAADDALVLTVLTISSDGTSTTANLLAPVVINARKRIAAQVILSGSEWPVRAVVA